MLIANFGNLSLAELQGIVARGEQRAADKYDVSVIYHEFSKCASVTGRAQDVMFIIGDVAAEGWDCLRSVSRV